MRATMHGVMLTRLWLAMSAPLDAEDWPRFRGPNGQGVSGEVNLPVHWSATERVTWETPILGKGWSSPIVHGAYVFLITAMEEGKSCRVIYLNRSHGTIAWNTEVLRQVPGKMRDQKFVCHANSGHRRREIGRAHV